MGKKEEYEAKTEAILKPIIDEYGFELVDLEYVKEGSEYYLRAYIDKEGGISIDDCEKVSRRLSDRLDAEDFVEGAYILEVSSPGLGRQLKKDRDFVREQGREVDVKLFRAEDGAKEFTGTLKGFDAAAKTVTVEVNGKDTVIDRDNIAKISLALDF